MLTYTIILLLELQKKTYVHQAQNVISIIYTQKIYIWKSYDHLLTVSVF